MKPILENCYDLIEEVSRRHLQKATRRSILQNLRKGNFKKAGSRLLKYLGGARRNYNNAADKAIKTSVSLYRNRPQYVYNTRNDVIARERLKAGDDMAVFKRERKKQAFIMNRIKNIS